MRRLLFFLFIFSTNIFPQISLLKEEVVGGKYRLVYAHYSSLASRNSVSDVTEIQAREDSTSFDYSLFIALPPHSRPEIRGVITKRKEISHSAVFNPKNSFYELKGYLWLNNFYCAHVKVFPYVAVQHRFFEVQEFYLEADIEPTLAINFQSKLIQNTLPISNPHFGAQWKVQNSNYTIQQTDNWIDYNNDYVKVGVTVDGIYRIGYNELLAFGVPVVSINPKTIKLFLKGKQIPIYVSGEGDNVFHQGDFIEFLGRRNYGDARYRETAPYNSSYYEYLNRYSDTTIYWLTWGGSLGMRVDTVSASGSVTDTLQYYDHLVHSERDMWWDFSLLGGDVRKNDPEILENETWHEGNLNVGKLSVGFSVSNLFLGKPARAFVKLQDFASNLTTKAHNLALSINNTATKYDSGFIDKYQVKVLTANFPSSELKNGSNTVDIHSFAVAGNSINTVIRDWYELEYPRYLKTTTDSLNFAYNNLSSPTYARFVVTGLTSGTHSLYKFISADSSIRKITNFTRYSDTLIFTDSVKNGTSYFLLREDKIPAPIFFYKKKFTNLRSTTRQADYIAITHPVFLSSATSYASFISSTYGVTTAVIDVNDIYDEFNYGFFAPEPIREFLKATHTYWQLPKPKYVFLIGKGTYDFYGNKTRYFGAPKVVNYVPPYGNPVSDIWFVLWDSTGSLIPQMNIGRVPARSVEEFQSYAAKHQKYVTKGFDDWNKRYMFFAGGNFSNPGQIAQSKGVNEYIINNYVLPPPIGGNVVNFYKTTDPISNFGPYSPEHIKNAIEQGSVFISYIGHSGTQTWDNSITDVSQLANIRDRNPLITDFGCSTAKFAEPDVLSFSELAVNSISGQAIAYIGNSSLGFESTAFTFPKLFYKKLLVDTSASLGDVHRLSKIDFINTYGTSGSYSLFAKTNTLIGDPIVKLPIPSQPNLTFSNAAHFFQPEFPTDQTDSITITLKYYNFGAVINDSFSISIKDEWMGTMNTVKSIRRAIPFYEDSIIVVVPVNNMPGEHTITFVLDSANTIDEIYEADNIYTTRFLVAATTIRNLSVDNILHQTNGAIIYLNPSAPPTKQYFVVEVSEQPTFSTFQTYQLPYDTFFTSFNFSPLLTGKRVWARAKYDESSAEGRVYSYRVGSTNNFLFNDSISFGAVQLRTAGVFNNVMRLDSTRTTLSVISAGFNDGNTAVILNNGQNFVPENTLRGHHVVLFDATTFQVQGYYRFDVAASASIATSYKNFLDTLNSQFIVAIGVSDEGAGNLSSALKTSIKSLGSRYIDSLKFRGSWAIIGRKGATPGTVPEKFSNPFQGRVQIDTTIVAPDTIGMFETPALGPVQKWENVELNFTNPSGSAIDFWVLGVRNETIDTLLGAALSESTIDLSSIDAVRYPRIKLAGALKANSAKVSPIVSSIAVNYTLYPELGANYQAVKLSLLENGSAVKNLNAGDTVLQGEKVRLTYRVYNAGGSAAKSFTVKVFAIWENNYTEQIANVIVDSVSPLSYKELSVDYNTALGFGRRNMQIFIDADTSVTEFFKDNNYFVFPFSIKKNETLPVMPNLAVAREDILPALTAITDEIDSVQCNVVYKNTGAVVNDSITIAIKHFIQNSAATEWLVRRKYPSMADTIVLSVPILKRAGEHSIQVELDPFGLVTELSELDNIATYYFTVTTTAFKIIVPNQYSVSSFKQMLFLNPTEAVSQTSRTALLNVDTTNNFSSEPLQIPMQEFTTSYNISSFMKGKRYYWRIKELGSVRDYTTGSFFLGADTIYALGQSDSVGWMNNTFYHATYQSATGAQIQDTRYAFEVNSAGFNDGRTGSVVLNGVNIISPILGTGHNIAVLDTANFTVTDLRRFDVANDSSASDSLTQFIISIPNGRMVIDVIVDDGSNNLQQAARNALKTIGSAYIDQVGWRDSWAIIGRKGAAPGSVPERYKAQSTGAAFIDTTIIREEYYGAITTPLLGVVSGAMNFTMESAVPSGTSLRATLAGYKSNGGVDSVLLFQTSGNLSVQSQLAAIGNYSNARLRFELSTSSGESPSIQSWSFSLQQPGELAISSRTTSLDRTEVLEGEEITLTGYIYNLGISTADSVRVILKTNRLGIITPIQQSVVSIPGADSLNYSYTFNTRGKKGDYAFILEVVPPDSANEVNKTNNSITLPFTIISDSIRPQIQVLFNGKQILNEEQLAQYPDERNYISQNPEVLIQYTDDNPTRVLLMDTSNFKIYLNDTLVHFVAGGAELKDVSTPGRAEIVWKPTLAQGENFIKIFASDVAGNYSDTMRFFVTFEPNLKISHVYNIPNPFSRATHFTFQLAGAVNPDEAIIKIYTVAGRLIHEINALCSIGFNSIFWDGRDKDGDEIGNGLYLYRIIIKGSGQQVAETFKLVKMK